MGVMNAGGYDQALAQRLPEQDVPLGMLYARIRQLEELNAKLAAEMDRQRPIVDAAVRWNTTSYRNAKEIELALDRLGKACDAYESSKPK